MENKQISVKKAAELINVTPHYIRKLLRERKIEGNQNEETGRWTVDISSLEKFKGTEFYRQDLDLLAKQITISIKEAVEDVETNFDCNVISYIAQPSSPFSLIDQNDCIFLDDLLYNQKEVYEKGIDGKKYKRIGLFLHSGGGILEAAIKFVDIIRQYANEYIVIIPLLAKSAATAMVLNADKVFLTTLSELGPVDPMVQSPINPQLIVPATAIYNLLKYSRKRNEDKEIDATSTSSLPQGIDPLIQKKLEDGIDPYLLGAHITALEYSKQEVSKALIEHTMQNITDKAKIREAIKEFTEAHESHSHPITYTKLSEFGIGQKIDDSQLRAVKTLMIVYQQFMANSNIVKLIGNRDENKNIIFTPMNPTQQVPTRTSL